MITLNKVASLQKESQDAVSIFEKTVSRLNKINEKIVAAKTTRIEKIDALQAEVDSLVASQTKNDKLVTKINSFLVD